MTASLTNFQNGPYGNQIDGFVYPQFIAANRAPTALDIFNPGTRWMNASVTPRLIYETSGAGDWDTGGVQPATTLVYGTVTLTDNTFPVATKAYADALAIAGAPVSTDTVAGIGQLATNAEAVAGTASTAALALFVTPSNLSAVFAAPPATGGTTPAAGAFTSLSASTTLTVTGLASLNGSATINSAGTAINIGNDASADAVNVGTGAAARTITLGNSTGATSVVLNSGTGAINIGTNAIAHTVTIGNVTGATAVNINAGTGGSTWTTTNATLALASGTGAINIGADAAAHTITVGNSTGATSVVLNCGTGNLNVGTNAIAHTITIGNSTGATSVVLDSGTGAINIGTNAVAHTVTIGNVTGATAVNLTAGSGGVNCATDFNLTSVATKITMNGGAVTDFIGRATLIGGTVTVLNTNIAAGDRIIVTRSALNASPALGFPITTINAGVSFVIASFSAAGAAVATDVSTFDYIIIRQT